MVWRIKNEFPFVEFILKSKGSGYRWIPFIRGVPFRAQPIPQPPPPPPMYQVGIGVDTYALDPETNVGNPDYEYQDNFEEYNFDEGNFDEGNFDGFEDDNRASYRSDDRYSFDYQ